jgi:hypothetical protein
MRIEPQIAAATAELTAICRDIHGPSRARLRGGADLEDRGRSPPASAGRAWSAPSASAATRAPSACAPTLRYDGQVASGNDNHAFNVGLRFSW